VKGLAVIQYRTFRNVDPPAVVAVWNQCFTGRGATILRGSTLIEYFTFAKLYFDPLGMILAFADGVPVGFAHAGFGPTPDGAALDHKVGVLCTLAVVPSWRHQGIGSELLRRAEDYLRARGAAELLAGPLAPRNPFTFGIYGGSQSSGFLDSDTLARPFLEKRGYRLRDTVVVLQRKLAQGFNVADARFAAFRTQFEVHAGPLPVQTWCRESVLGPLEAVEFRLVDRTRGGATVARTVLWEMETFRPRWDDHAVGVLSVEVQPDLRRRGLAKFLLTQILRHLQEQYFSLVEMQVLEGDAAGRGLAGQLGFQPVDAGRCLVRPQEVPPQGTP
jgi:ribosomal protein S18 acetylase RimI-like enzyme